MAVVALLALSVVSPSGARAGDDTLELPSNYPHGDFRADCRLCHVADAWVPAKIGADFDHGKFASPLRGAHEGAPCLLCHVTLSFDESLGSTCADCHSDVHLGELGTECQTCHSTQSFSDRPEARREHRTTRFPLTGAHSSASCDDCHRPSEGKSATYAGTPLDCLACHRADYETASNPDHARSGFPTDCAECHSDESWSGGSFDHSLTRFPLTGAHAATDCQACHVDFVFTGTPMECAACHDDDYRATADPPHEPAGFPLDCAGCHGTASWDGAAFDHSATGFMLTGAHETTACLQCHTDNVFAGTPADCYACHRLDYESATNPDHSAGFPTDCTQCHGTAAWTGAAFDHSATGFDLTGAHLTAACLSCHVGNVYAGTSTECSGCHQADFDATTDPNHAAAAFTTDCASCHGTDQWPGASFDHATTTGFALTGAHATAACLQCHAGNVYAGTPADCYSCHQADYEGTVDPDHTAGFPTDCTQCHDTTMWGGVSFDHATTGFALTGAHLTTSCLDCHVGGVFSGTPADCYACHQPAFDATTDPNHTAAGFATDCAACHTTDQWPGATFDHAGVTGFALTGAHATTSCLQCHAGNVFIGTPTDCYACHQLDYEGATNPDHNAGFPTDCTQCHGTAAWTGAAFDHSTTGFALTGAHLTTACMACHVGNVFAGTPTDCYACHQADFDATTDPNHAAAAFTTDCAACHGTDQWPGASFDHAGVTGFALTGAHATTACLQCHAGNVYAGTPADCYACHQLDYEGATDPDHNAGFPTDCTRCHGTAAWTGAAFDHSTTGFELTGAHLTAACMSCHAGNVFAGTPTDCAACHQADFDGTTNPDHAAAGFTNDCAACHGTDQWPGATFDHAASTGYALTGAHATVSCLSCHAGNVYAGTSTACYACHQTDFEGTTEPDHVAANFSTDCAQCHDTSNWSGSFDHGTTGFPLTGAHTGVSCTDCHVGNVYAGTPTDCYSCHQSDYEDVGDPDHVGGGFPTDCTQCHGTADWSATAFDHNTTGFPLHGAHASAACIQCHADNTFTGTPTDCYACHRTDYETAPEPDHVAANFPTDCTQCHGTFTWAGASFDHTTTGFPLTGSHLGAACLSCHVDDVYAGLPSDCYACHQTDYLNAASPDHVAAGMPTTCADCHDTILWGDGTFDHDATSFPLTGAHVMASCTDCHVGGEFAGTPAHCYACHQTDYDGTASPNHGAAGFSTSCADCHDTTTWSGNFDHAATGFPLNGAHATVACADCHAGNVYAGTPTDCYACHQADYEGTSDPNHAQLVFPLDCARCHDETQWQGAQVDHDFPIYSGRHRQSRWNVCSTCHENQADYGDFTCFSCHPHSDKNKTDDTHGDVNGYTYTSQACYDCHPRG